MSEPEQPSGSGNLTSRLVHFGRLLRDAGLGVSTHQIVDLAEALTKTNLSSQEDFYHVTRSFLVHGPEERELFDRLFDIFWLQRVPWYMGVGRGQETGAADRAADNEADADNSTLKRRRHISPTSPTDIDDFPETDETAVLPTYSAVEILRKKDFADYTQEDVVAATEVIRGLEWRLKERSTRRRVRTARRAPYADLRRTIQKSIPHDGEIVWLAWRRRKPKPPPLVVICDISGSMERYSELFLYLMFALAQRTVRVESFVFGTRLTRITPALRRKELRTALRETSQLVVDWSGGTRIGESLKSFNYNWARRVLGPGSVVLIISDGWDRGDPQLLDREIQRLHRSASRLVWLNPLSGVAGYEPLVRGIETVLPHIDDFLPIHNLSTLEQLAATLGQIRA